MKALFYWIDGPLAKKDFSVSRAEGIPLGPEGPASLAVPGSPAGAEWGRVILDQRHFYVESSGKLGEVLVNSQPVPPGQRVEIKMKNTITFGAGGPTVRFGFESEPSDFLASAEGGEYSPSTLDRRVRNVQEHSVATKEQVSSVQTQVTQFATQTRRRSWGLFALGIIATGAVLGVTLVLLRLQEQRALAREKELALALERIDSAVKLNRESYDACVRENRKNREETAQLLKKLEGDLAQLEGNREANREQIEKLQRAIEGCRLELREVSKDQAERFALLNKRIERNLYLVVTTIVASKPIFRDSRGRPTDMIQEFGTGFVIDDQGTLLTCKHVVKPEQWPELAGALVKDGAKIANSYVVVYPIGATWKRGAGGDTDKARNAYISWNGDVKQIKTAGESLHQVDVTIESKRVTCWVENDWSNDVAVLQLNPPPPTHLELASDNEMSALLKGHPVMLSGFPLGMDLFEKPTVESSVTLGNIRKIEEFLQHTAPTCAGNSGGPILNADGKVVAMVSYTRLGELVQAVNVGIPAPRLRRILGKP